MCRSSTTLAKTLVAATAVMVSHLLVATGCSKTARQESPSPPVPAPVVATSRDVSELEIQMADGATKKVSEFHGKVIVLDFWATYCKPCVEKLPRLQELAAEWGDKVAVIAVTLDPDVETATQWAKAHKLSLPIAVFHDAMKPILFPGEETIAIPQVRVIGPDGKLIRSLGPDSTLDDLKLTVSELLAAKK